MLFNIKEISSKSITKKATRKLNNTIFNIQGVKQKSQT